MEEWKDCKLEDICDVRDGTHDTPKQTTDGKYLVTSKHIKGGRIDLSSAYKISLEDFDFINRRSKVDQWDILISMIGTVGEICLVSEQPDFAIKNVGLIKTENEDLAKYLYYYLKSPEAQNNISARLKGTTQQYLSLGEIRQFPIKLPPLPIQQKIAAILSSLDDKIELNNKINTNLEQQAQALFDEMFKDYEKDILLGEVIETTSGGTPSRKNMAFYTKGNNCWVKSKELESRFIIDTEEKITDDAINNSAAKLLPENSVLIAMYGATVGAYGIISKPMTCNQAICALLPTENYPYTYLFMFAKNVTQELENLAVGSAQQNISQVLIKKLKVHSDTNKIKEFHSSSYSLFEQMLLIKQENKTLSELRDSLLPKLMNGEIEV